jgi:hypothetical protein
MSPGAPWFFGGKQDQPMNCAELRATKLADMERSIVILKPPLWPSFTHCLRATVMFPNHYRLAGTAKSPYDGATIQVYVPWVNARTVVQGSINAAS